MKIERVWANFSLILYQLNHTQMKDFRLSPGTQTMPIICQVAGRWPQWSLKVYVIPLNLLRLGSKFGPLQTQILGSPSSIEIHNQFSTISLILFGINFLLLLIQSSFQTELKAQTWVRVNYGSLTLNITFIIPESLLWGG